MQKLNVSMYLLNCGFLSYGIWNRKALSESKQNELNRILPFNLIILILDSRPCSKMLYSIGSLLCKFSFMLYEYGVYGPGLSYDLLGNYYINNYSSTSTDSYYIRKLLNKRYQDYDKSILESLVEEHNKIHILKFSLRDRLADLSERYKKEFHSFGIASLVFSSLIFIY